MAFDIDDELPDRESGKRRQKIERLIFENFFLFSSTILSKI
jgi:hypothetical protein